MNDLTFHEDTKYFMEKFISLANDTSEMLFMTPQIIKFIHYMENPKYLELVDFFWEKGSPICKDVPPSLQHIMLLIDMKLEYRANQLEDKVLKALDGWLIKEKIKIDHKIRDSLFMYLYYGKSGLDVVADVFFENKVGQLTLEAENGVVFLKIRGRVKPKGIYDWLVKHEKDLDEKYEQNEVVLKHGDRFLFVRDLELLLARQRMSIEGKLPTYSSIAKKFGLDEDIVKKALGRLIRDIKSA